MLYKEGKFIDIYKIKTKVKIRHRETKLQENVKIADFHFYKPTNALQVGNMQFAGPLCDVNSTVIMAVMNLTHDFCFGLFFFIKQSINLAKTKTSQKIKRNDI